MSDRRGIEARSRGRREAPRRTPRRTREANARGAAIFKKREKKTNNSSSSSARDAARGAHLQQRHGRLHLRLLLPLGGEHGARGLVRAGRGKRRGREASVPRSSDRGGDRLASDNSDEPETGNQTNSVPSATHAVVPNGGLPGPTVVDRDPSLLGLFRLVRMKPSRDGLLAPRASAAQPKHAFARCAALATLSDVDVRPLGVSAFDPPRASTRHPRELKKPPTRRRAPRGCV